MISTNTLKHFFITLAYIFLNERILQPFWESMYLAWPEI